MEDEDFLTPEQIAEATRVIVPTYYVYYDNNTGDIVSVSNAMLSDFESFTSFPISFEVYDKFVTGQEQFKDWVVTRTKNSSNEFGVEIVSRLEQSIIFKNSMFEVVDESDQDSDVTIHWDGYNKKWIFILSDEARQKVYDKKVSTKVLNFFITYNKSFNSLIRLIDISLDQLTIDKVEIPFASEIETKIKNINLSTKHAFNTYALKVWDYEQDKSN